MPPEGTPTCHPSPMHMVPAEILWPEQPFAPRHRSQSQVRKQMRWLFSCQVLSAAQRNARCRAQGSPQPRALVPAWWHWVSRLCRQEERQGKPQLLWQKPLEQLSKGTPRPGWQPAQPWGTHGQAGKPPGSLGFRPLCVEPVLGRWRRRSGGDVVVICVTLS